MDADQKIAALEAELAKLKAQYSAPEVSPLAPAGGFPDLQAIKGVRFASAAAGVKYQGRDDVMLMDCVAGTSVAGVFTKSATRSANVLDCQAKLKTYQPSDQGVAIVVNSGNSNAFTGRHGEESIAMICNDAP